MKEPTRPLHCIAQVTQEGTSVRIVIEKRTSLLACYSALLIIISGFGWLGYAWRFHREHLFDAAQRNPFLLTVLAGFIAPGALFMLLATWRTYHRIEVGLHGVAIRSRIIGLRKSTHFTATQLEALVFLAQPASVFEQRNIIFLADHATHEVALIKAITLEEATYLYRLIGHVLVR